MQRHFRERDKVEMEGGGGRKARQQRGEVRDTGRDESRCEM